MNDEKNLIINSSVLINYAHGLLSADKAAQVKLALEQDEMMRWEYEGILELLKVHPENDPEEILEEVTERFEKKNNFRSDKKGATIVRLYKRLAVAAVILLVAGAGIFYSWQAAQHNPVKLAMNFAHEKYPAPDTREVNTDPAFAWTERFKEENFTAVVHDLQRRDSLNHADQFYLGLSYLKSSPPQAGKAEEMLRKAAVSGIEYKSDAWLYLGIAQILQQKNEDAITSLQNSGHPHAKELLDLLRR